MARKDYGINDYESFFEGASDEDYLNELIEALSGDGYEGTPWESRRRTGDICGQYSAIDQGSTTITEQ